MLLIINQIINSIKLSRMLLIINLINSIQLKLSDLTPHKSVSQIRCSNLQKIEEMSPPFLSLSHHSYQILDYLLFLIPFICFSFQTLLFDQHVSSPPKEGLFNLDTTSIFISTYRFQSATARIVSPIS